MFIYLPDMIKQVDLILWYFEEKKNLKQELVDDLIEFFQFFLYSKSNITDQNEHLEYSLQDSYLDLENLIANLKKFK